MKITVRIVSMVIIFSALYAILRYNVFKGVELTHFPLYIMNKIFSFSGFILLVSGFGLEPFYRKLGPAWFEMRKYLGKTGFVLIIMHIIMSFLLFRPEIYSKFFSGDGTLSAIGEWSMLFGTLGIAAYIIMHSSFSHMSEVNTYHKIIRSPAFGIAALLLSALHVAIMGYKGWLTPHEWYGGMPSITMISILVFIAGVTIFLAGQIKRQ